MSDEHTRIRDAHKRLALAMNSRAAQYRKWAEDAEAAGDLAEYRKWSAEADKCSRSANINRDHVRRQNLIINRRNANAQDHAGV